MGETVAGAFDWVEIRCSDVQASAELFRELFGWQVVDRLDADNRDYWIFDTADSPRLENLRRGALWLRATDEPARVVVYVPDIDAILKKATALGAKVIAPRVAQGSAFKAYIADLDGNVFGLWQD